MSRFGLLGEDERELDFVLQLTTEKMLERRLQTKVRRRCMMLVSCGQLFASRGVAYLWRGLVFQWRIRRCALGVCVWGDVWLVQLPLAAVVHVVPWLRVRMKFRVVEPR